MLNPPIICGNCMKPQPKSTAMIVMDAAPPVKDAALAKQLAAEGRGASLGEMEICMKCYLGGLPKKAEDVAA